MRQDQAGECVASTRTQRARSLSISTTRALAGRAGLGDASPPEQVRRWVGWARCGVPSTSPGASTRQPGGRAGWPRSCSVEGCPGLVCGRAMPGQGDVTQPPACKIVDGRVELMIVRTQTTSVYSESHRQPALPTNHYDHGPRISRSQSSRGIARSQKRLMASHRSITGSPACSYRANLHQRPTSILRTTSAMRGGWLSLPQTLAHTFDQGIPSLRLA